MPFRARAQVKISHVKPRFIEGHYCIVENKHYIILDDAELVDIVSSIKQAISGFVEVLPKTVRLVMVQKYKILNRK